MTELLLIALIFCVWRLARRPRPRITIMVTPDDLDALQEPTVPEQRRYTLEQLRQHSHHN
jgi:hypothetical protein